MARKPANRPTRQYRPASSMGNAISFHFVDGAFIEITGDVEETYLVEFIDTRTKERVHQAQIRNNHWVRTARQFFTPWQVNVFRVSDRRRLFTHEFDARRKRVYIALESKALGDTLAWFQNLEAFRRLHGCELICSTFMNGLFCEQYPEIQFVEPGATVNNLYAMYRVGWFYQSNGEIDFNRNPGNFRKQPLGESAADILGVPLPARPAKHQIQRLGKTDRGRICLHRHSFHRTGEILEQPDWMERSGGLSSPARLAGGTALG